MNNWPVSPGGYTVADPTAPIAVCTLTDHALTDQVAHPSAGLAGVAIAGWVHTANLGIERIVTNLTANPNIRFLLVCGADSPLFGPGQTLAALAARGISPDKVVLGATGYEPVLHGITQQQVARFRDQIELVDHTGTTDLDALAHAARSLLARNPGPLRTPDTASVIAPSERFDQPRFSSIRPGGRREGIGYDPAGYFVITLDRPAHQIVLHHYHPDHTPAHQMRGHSAESILAGLLREGLVTQLGHAGYLGAELTKAHTALRLGLRYDQDHPLQATPTPTTSTPAAEMGALPRVGGMGPVPVSPAQLVNATLGDELDLALEITTPNEEASAANNNRHTEGQWLAAVLLHRSEPRVYHRTTHTITLRQQPHTSISMGNRDDIGPNAVIQAHGHLTARHTLTTTRIAILTDHVTVY
jgi:tetrahydromethanopterin S-methyltransferase subunit A